MFLPPLLVLPPPKDFDGGHGPPNPTLLPLIHGAEFLIMGRFLRDCMPGNHSHPAKGPFLRKRKEEWERNSHPRVDSGGSLTSHAGFVVSKKLLCLRQ